VSLARWLKWCDEELYPVCLDGIERCGAFVAQLVERDTVDEEFYVAAIPGGGCAEAPALGRHFCNAAIVVNIAGLGQANTRPS
jgi:hypothetical protein